MRHTATHWTWGPFWTVIVPLLILVVVGTPAHSNSSEKLLRNRVLVSKVTDGDTIWVGQEPNRTKVRLKCIDTPETVHPRKPVEPYGPEASEFTKRSLAGKWVDLEIDEEDLFDHFGRTLGYVFLDDGTLFNLELVRQGYARATTKRFSCRYRQEIEQAQTLARTQRRGLWKIDTPDAPCAIAGNARSKVYHSAGQAFYRVADGNRVCFDTEQDAIKAGYRPASR